MCKTHIKCVKCVNILCFEHPSPTHPIDQIINPLSNALITHQNGCRASCTFPLTRGVTFQFHINNIK